MKIISNLLLISVACLTLAGCPKKTVREFTRTSLTKNKIVKNQSVSTYRQECQTLTDYGQHKSCGAKPFQSHEYDSCVRSCNAGHIGSFDTIGQDRRQRCEHDCGRDFDVEYRTCSYEFESCKKVVDRVYDVEVELNFIGAPLRGSEQEKVICTMIQRGTKIDVKLKMKSEHYEYEYPKKVSFDLRRQRSVELNFKKLKKK